MPANECRPFYETGDVTFQATAAVTGKRFLAPSGTRTSGPGLSATSEGSNYQMATCGAGAKPSGVSAYDVASGSKGPCLGQPGKIVPVTAGTGGVTAGQEVMSDATGQAVTWTSAASEANKRAGLAMATATAGADAEIKLY
jgi:hypothetical protein